MTTPREETLQALVHSARTLNKFSVAKRQWAMEAARNGKPELADRWGDEANRLRIEAVWQIRKAQEMKDQGSIWPH